MQKRIVQNITNAPKNLESLVKNMSIEGYELFMSALLVGNLFREENNSSLITKNHLILDRQADGEQYYSVAKTIFDKICSRLTFVEAVPYPLKSNRIGIQHQELAFIDDGPGVVMAFPKMHEEGSNMVSVEYGMYHGEEEVSRTRLSKRMHDDIFVVDSFDTLQNYIRSSIKKFREANPFLKLEKPLERGDLVFMEKYPRSGFLVGEHAIKQLGNTLQPKDRLATVVDIIDPKVGIYELKSLSKNVFQYKIETNREQPGLTDFIDDVFVIKPKGWNEEDLTRPFMSNESVEEIIWPILLEHGIDPSIYASHLRHQSLLRQQFSLMIKEGASAKEITQAFTVDYGVTPENLLNIAGGDKSKLIDAIIPRIHGSVLELNQYNKYAKRMVESAAAMAKISELELVLATPEKTGLSDIDKIEEAMYRKIRGENHLSEKVTGYVTSAEDCIETYVLNINSNMFNRLCVDCVEYQVFGKKKSGNEKRSDVKIAKAPAEYKTAESLFELSLIQTFLENQLKNLQDAKRISESDLEKATKAVAEVVTLSNRETEDKYQNIIRENRLEIEERTKKELDSTIYQHYKSSVDERIIGPLLDFGLDEESAKKFIATHSKNHPLLSRICEELFDYRRRVSGCTVFNNPKAKLLLKRVVDSGADSIDEVTSIMETMMENKSTLPEEQGLIIEAGTSIMGAISSRKNGMSANALEELMNSSMGTKSDYVTSSLVSNIINECMTDGRYSPLAVSRACEAKKRTFPARLVVKTSYYNDSKNDRKKEKQIPYIEIVNSVSDIDMELPSMIVFDEVARLNAADERNKRYFEATVASKPSFEVLSSLPVFPLRNSNCSFVLERNKEGYSISLSNLSVEDVALLYKEKPDIDKEIKKLEELGFPVAKNGNHVLSLWSEMDVRQRQIVLNRTGSHNIHEGFYLMPEYEISRGVIGTPLFNLCEVKGDFDSTERNLYCSSKRLRHSTRDFEYFYGIDFTKGVIKAEIPEYLGVKRIKTIMSNAKRRIEKELNLEPDKILSYSKSVLELPLAASEKNLLFYDPSGHSD